VLAFRLRRTTPDRADASSGELPRRVIASGARRPQAPCPSNEEKTPQHLLISVMLRVKPRSVLQKRLTNVDRVLPTDVPRRPVGRWWRRERDELVQPERPGGPKRGDVVEALSRLSSVRDVIEHEGRALARLQTQLGPDHGLLLDVLAESEELTLSIGRAIDFFAAHPDLEAG
jgi:hypothetical protein